MNKSNPLPVEPMMLDRRKFINLAALTVVGTVLAELKVGAQESLKDVAVKRSTLTIQPNKRYLNFPVKTGGPMRQMTLAVDGKASRVFRISLADAAPDWWAFMELQPFKGASITIDVTDLPENSTALRAINQSDQIEDSANLYREERRPQFHFSSQRGWLNDPHVVFYDGEYHLFYQHNPYDWSWGNGHWGHAVSTDLVHWRELPIALYPEPDSIMQSGSIVVDRNNTAGFQTGKGKTLVALFTTHGRMHFEKDRLIYENAIPATQGLAFSNDRGRTWTKYKNNPIIPHIIGDNRDPSVFWHEPVKKWIMGLYLDKSDYSFFSSVDLKKWDKMSDIELPGERECPELFELAVDGDPKNTRWIFHGVQSLYEVGAFNGESFKPELGGPHKLQYGNSWIASQKFRDIPAADGRCIVIAWGLSEAYSGMPFNQAMSIPVELTLRTTADGLRLFSNPVEELKALRTKSHRVTPQILSAGKNPLADLKVELFDLVTEIAPGEAAKIVFNLRGVSVVYDIGNREVSCGDRKGPLEMENGKIRLRMLVDRTSIDIFGNDGRLFMPMGMIVPPDNTSVAVVPEGGNAQINTLELFELKSAWTS